MWGISEIRRPIRPTIFISGTDAETDCWRTLGIGWTKSAGRLGTSLSPLATGFALSQDMKVATVLTALAVTAVLIVVSLLLIRRCARRLGHFAGFFYNFCSSTGVKK
jgi:hypothetical protein